MIAGALVTAALGGLALAVRGALHRNSGVFGVVQTRLEQTGDVVALTFDDGPHPEWTPRILDALDAAGAKATFFMLGRHVDRWPETAREVASRGHVIGNHGYHHRKLHLRGPAYTHDDIALGHDSIVAATGVTPRIFRAPHGFRAPWTTGIAMELGERTVGWTLGVWDTDMPGATEIERRSVTKARAGTILLLHDADAYDANGGDRSQTAAAVPGIIAGLRSRGFEPVLLR